MSYRPNDIYYFDVPTYNLSGISTNTDSVPWGQLIKNGIDDFSASAKVFVTNVDIGRYVVSGTIPSTYAFGNSVSVCVSGQVAGLLSKAILNLGVLDSYVNTILINGVSVTGTPQVNVVSANPGVTVSVTGTFNASVTGIVPANLISINGKTVQSYDGFAQTGTINTITLAASEPSDNNYYQWVYIGLVGGSGNNQFGLITNYVGTTKVATIDHNWVQIPDSSTQYSFLGYGINNTNFLQNQQLSGVVGANFYNLFFNSGNISNRIVNNLWQTSEKDQLRYKLGIDGNAIIPTSGIGHLEMSASGWEQISIETGTNARQAIQVMGAALAGTSSGVNNTIWYQGMGNSINRISAVAISGIRSVVNLFRS